MCSGTTSLNIISTRNRWVEIFRDFLDFVYGSYFIAAGSHVKTVFGTRKLHFRHGLPSNMSAAHALCVYADVTGSYYVVCCGPREEVLVGINSVVVINHEHEKSPFEKKEKGGITCSPFENDCDDKSVIKEKYTRPLFPKKKRREVKCQCIHFGKT